MLQFIDQQRVNYPVRQICQVLDVVPSHYYDWRHVQAVGAVGTTEPVWETEMAAVFDHHKRRYGTRRLQVELRNWAPGWAARPGAQGYAATDEKPCRPSPSSCAPPI